MYDAVCNILTYCSLENIAIEYIEEFMFEGILYSLSELRFF